MKTLRKVRSKTILAALAMLGLCALATTSFAEVQLPEERLYEQMQAGEVEVARAGFEALVAHHVAQFNAVQADQPNASEARIIRATQLNSAIRLWQLAEVEQRLAGRNAPADLSNSMAAASDALIESAATVDQVRQQLSTEADAPEWLTRDSEQLTEQLGRTMLDTATFLRDADLDENRARLLQEAGRYTATPASLQELDAQRSDLADTFNVSPAEPRSTSSQGEPQARGPLGDNTVTVGTISDPLRDAAVQALLEDYYTNLFSGKVADLQTRFATGYWPEQQLGYVSQKLSGCVLDSLGDVRTVPVASDEYLVEIKGLVCIDATRGELTMADHLVVKRENGSYRILSLDARNRSREAAQ